MNLAITLLVVVAVASVIGTVLQQNEAYTDYRIEFGDFWFEVFRVLGLYNVYSASWFLFILAFLVVSTLVCVTRHLPAVWREVTRYRDHVRARSLTALRNHRRWELAIRPETAASLASGVMGRGGYRRRASERSGGTRVIAGMKGRANRLGYVMTHLAVVIIAVGALIDANLGVKWLSYLGDLEVVTEDRSMSQMPPDSRLPVGTTSFRGTVYIAEGQSADGVFLPIRDGHLLQELPFTIRLEDFRIRHYDSGQPKAFESDLVIEDERLEEPLERTISVNDPLHYRGYAIYQADFNDGGSKLDMRLWPLNGPSGEGESLAGRVGEQLTVTVNGDDRTIELTDFSVFNVRPSEAGEGTSTDPRDVETGRDFENVGPSFKYKLRRPSGEAKEFHNFLAPMRFDGAYYFLSGVRAAPGEPFRYLRIPADDAGSPRRFMAFLNRMDNARRVREATRAAAEQLLGQFGIDRGGELAERVAGTARGMIERLRRGGFAAVEEHLQAQFDSDAVGDERRQTLVRFSRTVLERSLMQLYRRTLAAEQDTQPAEVVLEDSDRRFFRDALEGISGLAQYEAPLWLELETFEHVQASGLQITRTPGKWVVYSGFGLLIGGVFLMFYVPHRRLWALVIPQEGATEIILAGTSKRQPAAFAGEFAALADTLDAELQQAIQDHD
jgi:cytochrome c biogenesis protein